jgi:hypothetical protein
MTRNIRKSLLAPVACAAMFTTGAAFAASDAPPPGHRIGYVLYEYEWALYQTPDGKAECPKGFNDGPREQFKVLFPDQDKKKYTVVDTQLSREGAIWWPKLTPEQFEFKEAQGKIGYGLNLDGKIGPNDFTSPEGDKGIDNNMYRALGCIANYRGPAGTLFHFTTAFMQQHNYDRVVFELTDVDSLVNDDDVTLTTYRGRDPLMTDSTGDGFLPGGTQRIDTRWGKEFIYKTKAKIKDGVLITEPMDYYSFPATAAFEDTTVQVIRGMRLKLKLTPDKAEGLMAGYTDVNAWYLQLNESWSTHHQSYGQESSPSLYRALHRLADGYPDPKTGQNTAISSALKVYFTQVFVKHPESTKEVASNKEPSHGAASDTARGDQ